MPFPEGTYGLLAEFDTAGQLTHAAKTAYDSGWRRLDCYTPYPCEEAAEAIGFHRNYVPAATLLGGLMGCAAMFLMETGSTFGRTRSTWRAVLTTRGRRLLCLRMNGRSSLPA